LKIVQKSFGVMRGEAVEPKGMLGRLTETGTMRVGEREPGGRVPPLGQVWRAREPMTSREWAIGVAVVVVRKRVRREVTVFVVKKCMVTYDHGIRK